MHNFNNGLMRCLVGVVIFLGLSAGAEAVDNCISANGAFVGSIGSQTTCADHNMFGGVIGSGESVYTYTGSICDFQVEVTPAVGESADDTTTFTVSNPYPGSGKPTCQLKMAIAQGNTGSNYCYAMYPGGASGDTMTTYNSKGTDTVPHKQLEVCTDERFAGEPMVNIEKTVVRVIDGEFSCNDAVDELDVIAPTEVVYCYTLTNTGQSSIDALLIDDDNGPGDDFTLLGDGTGLAGGATLTVSSDPVSLTTAGERVNTATVTGTYQGYLCAGCSDSDTATVNVVVACDSDTQTTANATDQIIEARDTNGTTRCAPAKDNNVGQVRTVSLLCDGSCEVKEECKNSPIACKSPCKPSGNWNSWDDIQQKCIPGTPKPGKLPLCQEVLGNPRNLGCDMIHNPAPVRSDGHSHLYSSNPYLYYFPGTSGGGTSTEGTIYCYPYPGEDPADVCPTGSFVY
jgi:hypothetical protein